MYIHPYVNAYIRKGLSSTIYKQWRREFGKKFKVVPNQALAFLEYKFYDREGKEIDVKERKDTAQSSTEKRESKANKASKNAAKEN